jgi:TonB family protein
LLVTMSLPGCVARVPAPPAVDARTGPGVAGLSAATPAQPSAESHLVGRNFSLINTKLELPPLPDAAGSSREGQSGVPLNTPDPRYAAYFAELKRRIEEKWVYPRAAIENRQSGQGELRVVLHKNGTVRTVAIVHSSGVRILDYNIEAAIRQAQPFPPIPASVLDDSMAEDGLAITINFNYELSKRTPPSSP